MSGEAWPALLMARRFAGGDPNYADGRSARELLRDWDVWRRDGQAAPEGDWRHWLVMAGRGFGKTRMGAEWVRSLAASTGGLRIALIGATLADARAVMVEGESGLLALSAPADRPRWEPSRGRLLWRSGAQAFLYSGENPEALRGPPGRGCGGGRDSQCSDAVKQGLARQCGAAFRGSGLCAGRWGGLVRGPVSAIEGRDGGGVPGRGQCRAADAAGRRPQMVGDEPDAG